MIATTINVHISILEMLEQATGLTGISLNELIVRILRKAMDEHSKLLSRSVRRVKYQERDEQKRWEKKHVRFSSPEYNYFQDIRKIYRMSISHILAYSTRKHLKKVVIEISRERSKGKKDNYLYSCYTFQGKLVGEVICWKFYWGIPKNLDEIMNSKSL